MEANIRDFEAAKVALALDSTDVDEKGCATTSAVNVMTAVNERLRIESTERIEMAKIDAQTRKDIAIACASVGIPVVAGAVAKVFDWQCWKAAAQFMSVWEENQTWVTTAGKSLSSIFKILR